MHPELGIMKKEENKYTIQLESMPFGNNDFQYVINDSFFGERDYSEVKSGIVNLLLNVQKLESMFILTLNLEGFVVLPCDRCGDRRIVLEFLLGAVDHDRGVARL